MSKLIFKFWYYFLFAFILIIWLFQLGKTNNLIDNNYSYLYEISKDVLTGTIALLGIGIAYEGLTTWRDQLVGNYDFDLACKVLRNTEKIKIAYSNFSLMWIFRLPNPTSENIFLHLFLYDNYWVKLEDLRTAVYEFQSNLGEIGTTWNDFPQNDLNGMLIKFNEYLDNAENFMLICSEARKNNNRLIIRLSNRNDSETNFFIKLCSDILFDKYKDSIVYPPEFRSSYSVFIHHYSNICLYLKGRMMKNLNK